MSHASGRWLPVGSRLLLTVGLWPNLAVLPVLSQLHLTFAAHEHIYCQEHQRFEDVLVRGGGESGGGDTTDTKRGESVRRSMPRVSTVACEISNLTINAATPTYSPVSAIPLTEPPLARPAAEPFLPNSFLLSRAPKHSPPRGS